MKCKRSDDAFKQIPIYDDQGLPAGSLRPITQDYRTALPHCAALLAKWRNENPTLSAKPFTATEEGTERWLDEQILGRDDRLLYLVLSQECVAIGHIGFSSFDYDAKCCEVDAVLRGDSGAPKGSMAFALRALLRWGIEALGLRSIRLRVFSDNSHAIRFYLRNGFVIEQEGLPAGAGSDKEYTLMRLSPEAWDVLAIPGRKERNL